MILNCEYNYDFNYIIINKKIINKYKTKTKKYNHAKNMYHKYYSHNNYYSP